MKNYSKEQIFETVEVSCLNGNCGDYHISWMYGKRRYEAQGEFVIIATAKDENFYLHEFHSPRGKLFNIYFSKNGCVTVSQVFKSDERHLGFSTELFINTVSRNKILDIYRQSYYVPSRLLKVLDNTL